MTWGAYYIFHVHGSYLGFTFHPSNDIENGGAVRAYSEPVSSPLGVWFPSAGRYEVQKMTLRPISFGTRQAQPVTVPGSKGSWDAAEAFPRRRHRARRNLLPLFERDGLGQRQARARR